MKEELSGSRKRVRLDIPETKNEVKKRAQIQETKFREMIKKKRKPFEELPVKRINIY